MERAKKMVLISMDNLERLQQRAHTSSASASSSSSSSTILFVLADNAATGINIASVENENTVRTTVPSCRVLTPRCIEFLTLQSLEEHGKNGDCIEKYLSDICTFFESGRNAY
ncbi:hypothetical protein EAI_12620 [Harpegnathos saltator]|uniref:Uncharacterized protein n=1 Tax=Harpegnathos saltator TaxID=610380 RepID=E2BNQ3_HARSA|nr:hypothetical protein EAI_12620 [Harpegnathos saltator]